jgi:c-di-GMP-binding flagellar brake protein YcgR
MARFSQERRKVPRLNVRQKVIIRPLSGESSEIAAVTREVSAGGVYVHADAGLAAGTRVEVLFLLPAGTLLSQGLPFRGTGEVLRVEAAKAGKFGIAIRFDEVRLVT